MFAFCSPASCFTSSMNCRAANYWYSGFIRLQSLIDAAIIQMQTKRSIWSEMDLKVVMMGQPGSVEVQKFPHALISIYLVLAFTPFVTFLIVNVAAEKEQRLKDTMTMMGLYDSAFWLSWGLLYAALVTTMSILMSVIATCTALFPNSDFFVVFFLIFLYGISTVSKILLPSCLYDSVLVKLMRHNIRVGSKTFTVYYNFFAGEFGMKRSLVYFLKPSYWSKGRNINNIRKVFKEKDSTVEALRGEFYHLLICQYNLIIISVYFSSPGLTFDIYEGQITALLGHSGAGKSTLMNILCGICPPTDGSASIYGTPVAEMADGSEMKQLVGICPQFNIIFDVLTVEEHLRIFAAIKGIPAADVGTEVSRVLKDLDLEKIATAQAKNLSGGQKRKLSVGIAILGDPKILLLDEPTAGMDPCSRHQVWSLLKNRRAGRVTVLSTHYMDEADILADRKAVISQGQLRCVGSSLFLKIKCGVGYNLRQVQMSINEKCDGEKMESLVKQHVPKAKLSRQHEAELTFTLPFESMDTFAGLFSELDSSTDLGVTNFGVSMTTLEDVFLRLEAEAEVDQAGEEQAEDDHDNASLDDTDQRLLAFMDGKSDVVSGHALWRQQFSTVAWLHMLNMWRERKIKCRSTLRISGLVPSAYWCGQAAVDIPFYYLILSSMMVVLFSFHMGSLVSSNNLTAKPVLVVSNLRKQYKGQREGFSFSKKSKVATKNVSFCVRRGEVLGLLGPNGAGKSTVMHMLSGDTDPTAGQVLMGDYSTEFHCGDTSLEHVGYCPQVNPLWPRVTLQEHLEVYAAIKGLKGQDVPGIIKRVVNALELKDHLNKQAKSLSAGLKRKLCFALSMIGNPQIVLLDEPSSGMDPKSKQRMWRAIRAAFKNRQRGAVLTTHYMEEAEAVCDRVAIMVSGQLRCIGSIQHLKGKYGRGYSLEVKLRGELTGLQQVALLHKEILRIFPHAVRQESFATLMVYKVPMEDVKSLAKAFSQLESGESLLVCSCLPSICLLLNFQSF
uniref:ATP binding cassette subfamily A member 5 n=1 Tax=Gouania willdenowi TaxID=441366 RepID=A0A8C5GPN1_GOUWI